MPVVKIVRLALIVSTSVFIGILLALLVYVWTHALLTGPYTLVREYFASFVALVVWAVSAILIGSFIENKTHKK